VRQDPPLPFCRFAQHGVELGQDRNPDRVDQFGRLLTISAAEDAELVLDGHDVVPVDRGRCCGQGGIIAPLVLADERIIAVIVGRCINEPDDREAGVRSTLLGNRTPE